MALRAFLALARSGYLGPLVRLQRMALPLYRLSFLAGASASGVLRLVASEGPIPFSRLAARLAPDPTAQGALEAWLGIGVRLGELGLGEQGYVLRGRLARSLADPRLDAVAALLEEVATLHATLLLRTPERLAVGRTFTLADQDGSLVARSSRILESLIGEAVDAFVPPTGPVRLLEIGCGSATYIRRAAARNPALTALGLDLQPEVAAAARQNLAGWGLGGRAQVEVGDVREAALEGGFDLATLHNNIYYFPVAERESLLRRVRGLLRPGGGLLLTTGCQGGSLAMEVLNLWGAATAGCGRLPTPEEMVEHIQAAGFASATARRLLPGESFFAFTARVSRDPARAR